MPVMNCRVYLTVCRSIMFELRVIEHERLVSKDKENKKAVLSRLMHSKKYAKLDCFINLRQETARIT